MWKLSPPKLVDALSDIDNIISAHSKLDAGDKNIIRRVFTQYHNQGGKIDSAQDSALPSEKREAMKSIYDETYKGKDLHYIRAELQKNMNKCPFCSISEASQLDHYLPKSKYKSVAVCRLNLVPSCGVCNNKKRVGGDFVHAYYDTFPNADFLIADVSIQENCLSVDFRIDGCVPDELRERMENQMNKTELHDRLRKEVNTFLFERFAICPESDEELRIRLEALRQSMLDAYGRNDWRTALIRGLQECPKFTAAFLRSYIEYLKFMSCNFGA